MGNIKNKNVLFVDDDEYILHSIKRSFKNSDYNCFYALNGKLALEILYKENIAVIVSDLLMPELDGTRLLEIVKEKYPGVIRIIATGVNDISGVLYAIKKGSTHRYITKPFNIDDELKPVIFQSLYLYNIELQNDQFQKDLITLNNKLEKINEELDFFKNLSEKDNKLSLDFIREVFGTVKPLLKEPDFSQDSSLNRFYEKLKDLQKESEKFLIKID